jgi:outer membrane protein TolC
VALFIRWIHVCLPFVALTGVCGYLLADEPLDVDRYVEIVLRSHPSAVQASGLQAAAEAESKSARLFPDPVLEYSRGSGRATEGTGLRGTETGYSISQTIPWPGTFSAGISAGDQAANVLRAGADAVRWELEVDARQVFARLEASRSILDIARVAENDARSLRDLVARRAELGESRESDRIKASVEWLRQRRNLAAEREAESAETIVRALAVEPLSRPLAIKVTPHRPLAPLDHDSLVTRVLERNPRARAARAEAESVHISLIAELEARLKELRVATEQANLLDADLPPAATKSVDLARFSYQKGETSLLTSKRTERARNTPGF